MEYLVGLDGHEDYLPTLLRSSLLRSPVLADDTEAPVELSDEQCDSGVGALFLAPQP